MDLAAVVRRRSGFRQILTRTVWALARRAFHIECIAAIACRVLT